ncbi:unnamed protein product [Cercopithifilaria johnstoni]|uniref:Uncharacterized protein n=1 Tax=Cercopithifilaria johnstoni TaxID=2874296 RepID=A0A8J2M1J7_9BILA|nr:unnamed protein product [Cercopithifilaria johnstoni]
MVLGQHRIIRKNVNNDDSKEEDLTHQKSNVGDEVASRSDSVTERAAVAAALRERLLPAVPLNLCPSRNGDERCNESEMIGVSSSTTESGHFQTLLIF